MIHKSAIIGNKVTLGRDVKIGPYCIIGDGAVIGNHVELKSHVVIEGRVTIGEGTKIYPFVSLAYPQTFKYQGEDSEILIGKHCTLREFVTVQHGTADHRMVTTLGDYCLLMVGVHVAHDCSVGNNVVMANHATLAGHVEVGDFVTMGGLSAVQQFCRLGAYAMIGGGSKISKDVIPFGLTRSDRTCLQGLNMIGMHRRGIDKLQSLEANSAVKAIFAKHKNSGNVFQKRIEIAQKTYNNNPIVQKIVQFLQSDESRPYCGYE
mmetsp:Transcript_6345/g.14350  ORF Transcript_6345/g.14350 Transcript_6345/m.14350 type:complete len:263 (+) Transcript_6345:1588-2376(+)